MSAERVQIAYYSDILCLWAYISQIRCDELVDRFGDQVSLEGRYFHVFGDVAGKMRTQWRDRGGLAGYAGHVQQVVEGFPHVRVHPEVWLRNTPSSSMPAHLLLCAVRSLAEAEDANPGAPRACAAAIREAFFGECLDVSAMQSLLGVAERVGVASAKLEPLLATGRAHAALSADLDQARDHAVRTSPTFLFNEERQRLTGNVGYRILEANVRELLERPEGQSSWC